MNIFVNRAEELASLRSAFARKGAGLYILYGRRRLGKTRLLKELVKGVPSVYHVADRRGEKQAIASLARSMGQALGEATLEGLEFKEWEALLAAFDRFRPKGKFVLILDEFQYLCETQPAMASIVQRWWDEHWSQQDLLVILCGSLVSMMHRETLSRSSPLYGRRTAQWLLDPLSFRDVAPFFPGRAAEELVRFWALVGGVPYYANLAAPFRRSRDALRELVLKKDGPLYAEARFLLQDEVRVPGVYWSLLQTIGSGVARISEIAGRMGLKANQLTRYLAALQDSRLIAREVPATEERPGKSKRGVYEVVDPFLRLWFGLVSHVVSYLELGQIGEAERWLEERIVGHWSWAFERICREYVQGRASELGVARVGRYWDHARELDIVGIGERGRVVFAGECKWTSSPLGANHLEELKAKVLALWPEAASSCRLALFSRSGFSPALKAKARADGTVLVDPRALTRRR